MSIPEPNKPWDSRIREAAGEAATQVEQAAAHVEQDLKRMVSYINDEVMPDVRRNGSSALRAAAMELQRLAHRMEDANRVPGGPPPPRPPIDL